MREYEHLKNEIVNKNKAEKQKRKQKEEQYSEQTTKHSEDNSMEWGQSHNKEPEQSDKTKQIKNKIAKIKTTNQTNKYTQLLDKI